MSLGDLQATVAATVVDEWIRCGVRHAVVCPGSRSTPLALALADRPEIRLQVRLDERAAAFSALGIGLAGAGPAVLLTTSGTAAAEVHAAVVEAHHAGVPLVVVTADRPAELHQVGANQTIEQQGLYGAAVRLALHLEASDPALLPAWRSVASRLVAEARAHPAGPGPVHLNLGFRDPLLGQAGPLPPGRPEGAAWHRALPGLGVSAADGLAVLRALGLGDRWVPGVIVAGAGCGPPQEVLALAEALHWPLLADPRSGCRRPGGPVVGAADAIVRAPSTAEQLRPAAVLRLGQGWLSKVLGGFLDGLGPGVPQVVVERAWVWRDPARQAAVVASGDPAAWVGALGEAWSSRAGDPRFEPDPSWLQRWATAERSAQEVLDQYIAEPGPLTLPRVSRALFHRLGAGTALVCAASLPVRGVEWYAPLVPDPPEVLANRGVNGIDGVLATARGVASTGRPTVALVGDLAFLHDLTAWLEPEGAEPVPLSAVVLDNGGGGIFSFLPQAQAVAPERFSRLFSTPQRQDLAALCRGLGLPVRPVADLAELSDALAALRGEGPSVIQVRALPPAEEARALDELHSRLASALEAALARP